MGSTHSRIAVGVLRSAFATIPDVHVQHLSRFIAPLLLGVCLAVIPGCADLRNPDPQDSDQVPPRSDIRLLWTDPEPATPHPVNRPVTLCFSGYLDPDSVRPGSASLSSGSRNYDSRLTFDLADWEATDSQRPTCPGSILRVILPADLVPDTRYRLRLVDRLQDWAGLTLSSEGDPRWIQEDPSNRVLIIEFQSAKADAALEPEPVPEPLSFRQLFEPDAVFGTNNPSCSCHQQLSSFNLRDPESLYQTLRYKTHGSGQPWIQPGHASWSYLIFKLLRDPQGHALPGVSGDPMPPSAPIKREDLRQIAQWINDGARP